MLGSYRQLLATSGFVVLQGCRFGYEILDGVEAGSGLGGSAGAPSSLDGAVAAGGASAAGGTGASDGSAGGTLGAAGAADEGASTDTTSTGGTLRAGGSGGTAAGSGGSTGGGASTTAGDVGGSAGIGGSTTTTGSGGDASTTGAGGSGGSASTTGAGGSGGSSGCTPTNGSVEACDGLDNDCNGVIDEESPCAADCFSATYSGHGYMFCGAPRLWADAQAYCTASSMSLVRIDDAAENAWVVATAVGDPVIAESFAVFIGAGDPVEGNWEWLDGEQFWSGRANGSPVGGLYSNWAGTEPNDQGAGGEDCAGVRPNGLWSDLRCSGVGAEMAFACETP